MLKFNEKVEIALYDICEYAQKHSHKQNIDEGEIFSVISNLGAPALLASIVERLLGREMIRQMAADFDIEYRIVPQAFIHVDQQLEDMDSIIYRHAMSQVMPQIEQEGTDAWSPLPIDRETEEFQDVVEAVEKAVQSVEQDNGYAANEPDERNQVVESLKTGLQWIKEGFPSLAQIRSTVEGPLKFLASKFSGAAMGEAAKVAVAKAAAWLASIL